MVEFINHELYHPFNDFQQNFYSLQGHIIDCRAGGFGEASNKVIKTIKEEVCDV